MRKADVHATLNKIGVEAKCPVCQANVWGGAGPEGAEADFHLQAIDADGQMTPGFGLECVGMICNYCGFVRLHAVQALEKHS